MRAGPCAGSTWNAKARRGCSCCASDVERAAAAPDRFHVEHEETSSPTLSGCRERAGPCVGSTWNTKRRCMLMWRRWSGGGRSAQDWFHVEHEVGVSAPDSRVLVHRIASSAWSMKHRARDAWMRWRACGWSFGRSTWNAEKACAWWRPMVVFGPASRPRWFHVEHERVLWAHGWRAVLSTCAQASGGSAWGMKWRSRDGRTSRSAHAAGLARSTWNVGQACE